MRPALFVLVTVTACAAVGPNEASSPPPTVAAPKPSGARWELAGWTEEPSAGVCAPLEAGLVCVGPRGDRWLRSGGAFRPADTVLPEPILAVRQGKTFSFFGHRFVYLAKDPLGPIETRLALPGRANAIAVGKAATLVVDAHARVSRSMDGGLTWATVALGGTLPLARHVGMTPTGRGVVFGGFGRAWQTDDDGASFQPTKTPFELPDIVAMPRPPAPTRRFVATASGALAIHSQGRNHRVRRLEGADETLFSCDELAFAAAAKEAWIGCREGDLLSLHVSHDDGRSFVSKTREPFPGEHPALAAGPDGFLGIVQSCEGVAAGCARLRVRYSADGVFGPPPELASFRALEPVPRFDGGPPLALVFADDGRVQLVRFEGKPRTVDVPAGVPVGVVPATSAGIDDQGNVLLPTWDGQELLRISPDGVVLRTRAPHPARRVHLQGRRGLLAGGDALFETRDAGRSWSRVNTPLATHEGACGAWGCAFDDAVRIGWDLDAAAEPSAPLAPVTLEPAGAPLRCTQKGASITTGRRIDLVSSPLGRARMAWSTLLPNDEKGVIATFLAEQKQSHLLLPPMPQAGGSFRHLDLASAFPEGVMAARHRWKRTPRGSGILSPVAVDLAWVRARDGIVHRATLPDVGRFKVGYTVRAPSFTMFDGGVIYDPVESSDRAIHVLWDDGRHDTLPSSGLRRSDDPFGWDPAGRVEGSALGWLSISTRESGVWKEHATFFPEQPWTVVPRGMFEDRWAMLPRVERKHRLAAQWLAGDGARAHTLLVPELGSELSVVDDLSEPGADAAWCSSSQRESTRVFRSLGFLGVRPVLLNQQLLALRATVGGPACVTEWMGRVPGAGRIHVFEGGRGILEVPGLVGSATLSELTCEPAALAEARAHPDWSSLVVELP